MARLAGMASGFSLPHWPGSDDGQTKQGRQEESHEGAKARRKKAGISPLRAVVPSCEALFPLHEEEERCCHRGLHGPGVITGGARDDDAVDHRVRFVEVEAGESSVDEV